MTTLRTGRRKKPQGARAQRATYVLRLYVNRSTLKSQRAVVNLKRVCEEYLKGLYHLEVIDIRRHPNLARDEQIVAVPTLIKRLPLPLRRLVGDMSDLSRVILGLDLRRREE
jgi:circadian clock protein KaiB